MLRLLLFVFGRVVAADVAAVVDVGFCGCCVCVPVAVAVVCC